MKFTLYPNDELKFKIEQSWDLSAPETLIEGSYCYKYIKYLVSSREKYNFTYCTSWINILRLKISKDKGTVIYGIEKIQLDFQGEGKNLRVVSIDVTIDELTGTAQIKVNIEKVPSFDEKLSSFFARLTSGISKKIEEQKSKKIEKELNDKKNLEENIKQKAKETITNEYWWSKWLF